MEKKKKEFQGVFGSRFRAPDLPRPTQSFLVKYANDRDHGAKCDVRTLLKHMQYIP